MRLWGPQICDIKNVLEINFFKNNGEKVLSPSATLRAESRGTAWGLGPESLLVGAIYPQWSFSDWGSASSLQSALRGKEKAKGPCGGPGLTATLNLQHLAVNVQPGVEPGPSVGGA